MNCAVETTQQFGCGVVQYRPRRAGPESQIQDAVADFIPNFFSVDRQSIWAAASLPIGAGMPDLIAASYSPCVFALAQIKKSNPHVLAYLRAFGRVRADTIANRTGVSLRVIDEHLAELSRMEVIQAPTPRTFMLKPEWRAVLSEVVAIEVKVADWQRAVRQAARNRIFCNQSYVAVPSQVATRISDENIFDQLSLGLLSIDDDGNVTVVRKSQRRKPLVWAYYYYVAAALAKSGN
jgi:hypothetical protein